MPVSIGSKVTAACIAVLVLSLLLLANGLRVGAEVEAANQHVDHLTHLLRKQNDEDRSQRELRLSLGEATRLAERGGTVPDVRWEDLSRQVRAFGTMGAVTSDEDATALPPRLQLTLAATRSAALAFVPTAQELVRTARRDPEGIKAVMPRFLDALRRLEAKRTAAREAVGRAMEHAVDVNIASSRRATNRSLAGALIAVAVLTLMAAWLRLRVVAPIVAVAARLRDLRVGDRVGASVPGLARADELGDLARGVFEYHQATEERRLAQKEVNFLAHHDALTGLPNRLLFENRLAHELARSRRTGDQVAVLAIDLDDFKGINDRLGHAAGDRALRRLGKLLADAIRMDDLVARIGGDEFAIIQVADAQPAAAEALLARLARVSAATEHEEVAIRMSIGVAVSTSNQDGEELRNSADIALYRAKSDGRNTARFFDATLQDEVRLRRRLARDLEGAIDAGQLRLAYQPIATASGRVTGFEALLRWRHPELGDIKPDAFIPIAEGTRLIGQIGLWVAERALSTAAGWSADLTLSLNLSPIQFREPDLGRNLLALAERCGVVPERLEFEVTESATLLGHQREAVLETLRVLQRAGAAIAMDDFGTGHSSLSNLKDFSFDKLKIDRSFVAGMLEHAPSASIVKATIGLGRSLGMTIVAEGVETDAQLDQLRAWGCDQVQGFLIGRPVDEPLAGAAHLRSSNGREIAA